MSTLSPSVFSFLNDLKKNNNREWFSEHKHRYIEAHEQMISFAEALLEEMKQHDQLATSTGKKSLMRIYRDVRFSKDKSPYKPRFAGSFSRIKPQLRGGYFFGIEPGNTMIGGGFYGPQPDDLKLIRNHIVQDDTDLREVLNSAEFKETFGELRGEQLKTAPKGFDPDHPAIDLLRYKSLYAFRPFTDEEVVAPNFLQEVVKTFLTIRPFFDVMTEYLTTDLNGISLLD